MTIEKTLFSIANANDSSIFQEIDGLLFRFPQLYLSSKDNYTSVTVHDKNNCHTTHTCPTSFIHKVKKAFDISDDSVEHRFARLRDCAIMHYTQYDHQVAIKLQNITSQVHKPLSQLSINAAAQQKIKHAKTILIAAPREGGATTTQSAILGEFTQKHFCAIDNKNTTWTKNTHLIPIRHEIAMTAGNILQKIASENYDGVACPIRDSESLNTAIGLCKREKMVVASIWGAIETPLQAIKRIYVLGGPQILHHIELVIAQYLIARPCSNCRKPHQATPSTLHQLSNYKVDVENVKFTYNVGCENCNFIGYSGQVLIYEMWEIDDVLCKMMHNEFADEEVIAAAKKTATLRETLLRNLYAQEIDVGSFLQVIKLL